MKKGDVIDQVVERTGLRKNEVTDVMEAAIDVVTEALRKHTRVHIAGLGVFEPRKRKARVGKDPRTQEALRIPPTWSLIFRPGTQLRVALTGKHPRERRSRTTP